MAITEEGRHRLYQRLEEVLGEEQATTLMEHLPPVGWADVATKRDLDHLRSDLGALEARMDGRFGALEARMNGGFDALRAEFYREQRNVIFAMLAANSTLAAVAFAAARLV